MTLLGEGGAHASHGQHGGGRGSPKTLSLRDSACVAKKCENRGGREDCRLVKHPRSSQQSRSPDSLPKPTTTLTHQPTGQCSEYRTLRQQDSFAQTVPLPTCLLLSTADSVPEAHPLQTSGDILTLFPTPLSQFSSLVPRLSAALARSYSSREIAEGAETAVSGNQSMA